MLLNFLIFTQCGTRLTLWIPNNLPLKWDSLIHIDTLSLEQKQTTIYLYHRSHTYKGHAYLKSPSGRLSIQGHSSRKPAALKPLVGKIRWAKTGEISNNENWANTYKGMTPTSTQNLKALGLRVFFLIFPQLSYSYPIWDFDSHLNI